MMKREDLSTQFSQPPSENKLSSIYVKGEKAPSKIFEKSPTDMILQNICMLECDHYDTDSDNDIASLTTSSTFPRNESVNSFDTGTMKVPKNKTSIEDDIIKTYMTRRNHTFISIMIIIISAFYAAGRTPRNKSVMHPYKTTNIDPRSVYVPGAGFSGFWFTLGRLQSIPNPREYNYHCFSAGCLGVVATLLYNKTVDDMASVAFDVQRKWRNGEISRYAVVEDFVDRLLIPGNGNASDDFSNDNGLLFDVGLLERINVLTTTKGIGVNMRQARSVAELRELLIQTTWIPFATGWGLWKEDTRGNLHMDGGVSMLFHPDCQFNLRLPMMFDLFLNFLNPNMGIEKVEKFWNSGLGYGIDS